MGTTPVLLLPYPAASDPADVPLDMQELADRIEAVRGATNGLASLGSDGKVPAAQLPSTALELGHTQITAPVTVVLTSEAAPVLVVAAPAITFDGTSPVLIEFFAQQVTLGASVNATMILNLWRDNTNVGFWGQYQNPAAANLITSVYLARRLVPPAGSHTYDVRAWANGTAGTIGAGPGGAPSTVAPAFIRVSRC